MLGALILPTVLSVMGILKEANLQKNAETNIFGESLFSDGIGVVIFATLLKIASVGIGNYGVWAIGELCFRKRIACCIQKDCGWFFGSPIASMAL